MRRVGRGNSEQRIRKKENREMASELILAINPGSTSTKIAVYDGEKEVYSKTLRHTAEEIGKYAKIVDQFEFREGLIYAALQESGVALESLGAIVGRGGLVKPVVSGAYHVNARLIEDLRKGVQGEHASNLGGLIANSLAKRAGGKPIALIADPVVVDELDEVARISGLPFMERRSIFHALNQKAIARRHAASLGKRYEELNLIVAHLGGGVSVGAHRKGRVVEVNNAIDGEGPFSPERAGTMQAGQLVDLCFSGKYTKEEIKKFLNGKGGLVAHLGTNNAKEVADRAEAGDKKAELIEHAMGYGVGKSIAECAAALHGKVDGILLTGGMAYGKSLTDYIEAMVSFIAPVSVYPGEDELGALAMNGLMVLRGEMEAREYE